MTSAVVTGAGQGLGRAIARRLAADGHDLVLVDVDAVRADEVADELGGRAVVCNVSEPAGVAAIGRDLDEVAVLVNNAGIYRLGSIVESSEEDLRAVVDVNLLGTVWCTRALTPHLRAGRGSVVNLSSGAATTCSPGLGTYPASKAAIEALTRQLALELAPDVRVNAVAPGLIRTEGTDANYRDGRDETRARAVPLGRIGTAEDIADVVAFLCSSAARYMTGQVLRVDGGLTAGRSGL